MFFRLLLLLVTLTVAGNAEDRGQPLPFPFSPLSPFSTSYKSVKNEECRKHGLAFLKELKELKLWAVQMYDASGKISSGLLEGNVNWLGNDRECLRVSSKPGAAEDDRENIRGQYCSFRIFADPRDKNYSANGDLVEIYDRIHTNEMIKNNADDGMHFFPSYTPLTMGLCIPHSCTLEDFETAIEEWFAPLNTSSVNIRLVTTYHSCTKGDRDLTLAYGVFSFHLLMTLIAIWGSLYEIKKERKGEDPRKQGGILIRIFLAFSFRSNMRALLDTSRPQDELSCLNGIRTILSLVLYFLHKGLLILFSSISNRSEMAEWLVGPKSMILRAFWNYVDTFVVMSGLLTSYYAIKKLQEGGKLNIPKMYIRRYLKLTPLYVASIFTGLAILETVPSEAHMAKVVQHFVTCCREKWWSILTYTNTFRGIDKMCHQPSHQLETDMHMYILSPFIILLLWKKGKSSILPLSLVIAALCVLKVYKLYSLGLGTILYYGLPITQLVISANELYLNFVHRLIPYISGTVLGYILRVRKENFKLRSGRFFLSGVFAAYGAYYSFLQMVYVAYPEYEFDPLDHATFGVLQPLLWSFSICWLIFACANGQAESLSKMLSWNGFTVTNRLSYAFYILQMPIMMASATRSADSVHVSISSLFDLNVFFICVVAAIWFTLIFLYPIGTLWNIFTEPSQKDSKGAKNQ